MSWHRAPEPRALLASIATRPPRQLRRTTHYALSRETWLEPSPRDPRVRRLEELHEQAFAAAERDGGDARAVALAPVGRVIAEVLA